MNKQIVWTITLATAAYLATGQAGAASIDEVNGRTGMTEQTQSQQDASKRVLEGVSKVGYSVYTSPFPGSLTSVLQYIKDPCSYDMLMSVSGAAFRRAWEKNDGGNVDINYYAPESFHRAADAIGYNIELIPSTDKKDLNKKIKESIDQGVPVLAFGVIGPPECGIITGYEQDGQIIYGYSYFQDSKVPGYYKVPIDQVKWDGPFALMILGDKKAIKPSDRTTLIRTLEWAIRMERAPETDHHANGLAAYEAWADAIEVDADYPKDNPEILDTRVMVHGDQTLMLYERDHAANYLREMAKVAPKAAEPLNKAADLFHQVTTYGSTIWPWGTNIYDPIIKKELPDAERRHKIAQAIREAGKTEAKAVEQLEKALAILQGDSSRFELYGVIYPGVESKTIGPESVAIPSSLRMAMDFLGESLKLDQEQINTNLSLSSKKNAYFSGVSGEAFRFWSTLYSYRTGDREDVIRRTLKASGYQYQLLLSKEQGQQIGYKGPSYLNQEELKKKIVDHLQKHKKPVILLEASAFPDWRLITGYQREGEVLLGYGGHFDSIRFSPGSFENPIKEHPLSELCKTSMPWVILLGDKTADPDLATTYRETLPYALKTLRAESVNGHPAGFKEFDAWIEMLEDDSRFKNKDVETLKKLYEDHRIISAELAERRFDAGNFMEQAAFVLPAKQKELKAASELFHSEHPLVWKIWALTDGPEFYNKLADPEIRKQIVEIIKQVKAMDMQAADAIERAVQQ